MIPRIRPNLINRKSLRKTISISTSQDIGSQTQHIKNMIPLKSRQINNEHKTLVYNTPTNVDVNTLLYYSKTKLNKQRITNELSTQWFFFHNHYVDNNECIIVIPVYKKFDDLTQLEKDSIAQCLNVLGNDYEICLLLPYNLGIKEYIEYFSYQFSTLRVTPKFFRNTHSYNKLCLNTDFYIQFKEYKYLLIYQTDAWVFKNELHEWCEKEYEYIGAPIHDSQGGYNGGLSLRLVEKFIEVEKPNNFVWEDRYFSKIMKCPTFEYAMHFSVQDNGEKGKETIINNQTFGCHYTNKYFSDLLPSNIDIKRHRKSKYDYSILIYNFNNYETLKDVHIIQDNVEYVCVTDDKNIKHSVWKLIYDESLDDMPTFNKCYAVRFNPFKYVTTDICMRIDGNVQPLQPSEDIIKTFNEGKYDFGLMIHPYRTDFREEYKEWVKSRQYSQEQADKCIEYFQNKGYNFDYKGLFQGTVAITRNTPLTHKIHTEILNILYELGDGTTIERIDQIVTSYVLNTKYNDLNVLPLNESIITDGVYFQWFIHHSLRKIPLKLIPKEGWMFNKEILLVDSFNIKEYNEKKEN